MNEKHLTLCASAEWADAVERWIIPWALESVDLGDDALEMGPGPGATTDVLRTKTPRLTAVELDRELASALRERLVGTNVEVICADASATSFPADRFSAAVCLTMLHHLPTAQYQDAVFAEMHRVLRPNGLLVGQDSLDSLEFRDLHDGDICTPVDPGTLADRLEAAGFREVAVDVNEYATRFRATK